MVVAIQGQSGVRLAGHSHAKHLKRLVRVRRLHGLRGGKERRNGYVLHVAFQLLGDVVEVAPSSCQHSHLGQVMVYPSKAES